MRSYLKSARESKGYTQQYVADSIGISQNYYCDIENGIRQKEIKAVLMFKLSELLEIPIKTMIDEEKKIIKEVT